MIVQLKGLEIPGLAIKEQEFREAREALCKDIAVFLYKRKSPLIWAMFTGGTGTGKSTLFNALCRSSISRVGMERPTTGFPVAYVHRNNPLEGEFPFPDFPVAHRQDSDDDEAGDAGSGKGLIVVEHDRDALDHLVLVDNPDLDSLEQANRRMADDMYRLSDVIIFVTSQEKYADEIPSRTLGRSGSEGRPCFVLFNKADPANTVEETVDFFRERGIAIDRERLWFIPHIAAPSPDMLAGEEAFRGFAATLFETLRKDAATAFRAGQRTERRRRLNDSIDFFLALAGHEQSAAERWLDQLTLLCEEQGRTLFEKFETHFKQDGQHHIQREIRNIYDRYDILSRPRHYVKQLLLAPLRLLGLPTGGRDPGGRKALRQIGSQVDITPVLSTVSEMNRLALETLVPEEGDSSFARALKRDEIALSDEEVRDRIGRLREGLIAWLEGKFGELARGIPRHKEVGIYSTAVMWGGLILSFEIVLGGGITFLEMALDSFLAPLVTKGSVNLFAFHEIRKIARELDRRHREGILDILEEQRQRYAACLEPFFMSDDALKGLKDLRADTGD